MALAHRATGHPDRSRTGSVRPTLAWIAAVLLAVVGLSILSVRVLSGLKSPGLDLICYLIAVIGVAAFLAYSDHRRDSAGKRPQSQGERGSRQRP